MMKSIFKISILTVLIFLSSSIFAQDNNTIIPGIQWDTTVVVKQPKASEHLIGIRYDYSFTGAMITPSVSPEGVNAPVNLAILYTYYHPMWSVYNYFGLQTGIRLTQYGFTSPKYSFEHFDETITTLEIPLISAFHIDLGKYFRILLSIGPFAGYRFKTTKDNGFDCFDRRFDYGVVGGAGVAFRLGKIVELHLEGAFHYSFSMLFYPEKMSSEWWLYAYPWQGTVSLGLHFKIK